MIIKTHKMMNMMMLMQKMPLCSSFDIHCFVRM